MDLVTGAMGILVPKLLQLLQAEYNLQRGIRAEVESLARELESMLVALAKVAQVRQDQLDAQVGLWARDAREASYDMEDVLDTFLVRVDDGGHRVPAEADTGKVKRLQEKMRKLFSISKIRARHDIAGAIEDIKKQVDEMAKRRERYRVDHLVTNSVATTSIDPRLSSLYTKSSELIDIDKSRDALINMLCLGDDISNKRIKIVSVVGSGGLGKTTLAKTVFEKLTVDMGICYNAFVPVGQNSDLKKILRDILIELDRNKYMPLINKLTLLDERQTIDELRSFLKDKRYFIVIDDIWELSLWNNIRIALEENHMESKIVITTRSNYIANKACCSYKMEPLGPESSKTLFHRRIFDSEDNCPEQLSELSEKILKKCGGVPLAIVTTASLLANTSQDINEWQEIYNAIGSGLNSSDDMCNMREILSLSYYHLPSHMKTCFLYLSIYPEDYNITRDRLISRWISEGFIKPHNNCDDLFKLGEIYFNDLINRSLIQPVRNIDSEGVTHSCRVHDMILDLICSLSKEENFVTILNGTEQNISCGRKPRRLSLKNTPWLEKDVSQVRSIAIFGTSVHSVTSISCFNLLRVLDLEGCRLEQSDGHCKLNISNLIHLRYLGLTGTKLRSAPEGIDKLKFLQVLKPGGSYNLPPAIFELRQLMCIESCQVCPKPGNLLRNLASLHVLKSLVVYMNSVGALEALGHLTRLRELHIDIQMIMDDQNLDALINSLSSLPKLQSLHIVQPWKQIDMQLDRWSLSPQLHTLNMFLGHDRLPKWINPTSLPLLTVLQIDNLRIVQPEDIQILGTLPALCRLILKIAVSKYTSSVGCVQKFAVSNGAFPCVKWCRFNNIATIPSMFPQGAMPKVKNITFCLNVTDFIRRRSEFDLDGDLAMGHLPSLRNVHYDLYYRGGKLDEVQKVQEALRHAVHVHPNNPSIKFNSHQLQSIF